MRRIPDNRFDELIDAAAEVFIERGYRRTQMSDVAKAVGVAKGTLYGYVESKEALFELCLHHADHQESVPLPDGLPLPTPKEGELSRWVRAQLQVASVPVLLSEALGRELVADPRAELEGVIGEYWDVIASNHRGIKLIDRCTDHPEIGSIWQEVGREQSRLVLREYIELRIACGQFRKLPSPQLAARMVIEVVATWAVHIHWDRAPEDFDSGEARENAIEFLVRGLLAKP